MLWFGSSGCSRVRVSFHGFFVNGVRMGRGEVAELSARDKVSLVCGNEGFVVRGFELGLWCK